MQLRIPDAQISGQTVINQTIVPPAREGVVSIVLDIDVFCDQDVSDDEDAIWRFLERLRVRKNEIFESCITDSSRKLFH